MTYDLISNPTKMQHGWLTFDVARALLKTRKSNVMGPTARQLYIEAWSLYTPPVKLEKGYDNQHKSY